VPVELKSSPYSVYQTTCSGVGLHPVGKRKFFFKFSQKYQMGWLAVTLVTPSQYYHRSQNDISNRKSDFA
jgi:hypothetical protein